MQILFLICAVLGGTLMGLQFLSSLFGLGGDHGDTGGDHDLGGDVGHDIGHDHADGADHDGSSWFFGVLSFRALSAAVTFFGLSGLAAYHGGLDVGPSLLIALGGGVAALYVVVTLMRSLARLKSDGTVRIERAVGEVGVVYLKVPGRKAGAGKVTLVLQNRTVECQAVTPDAELPTGARVRVVAVVSADTVEVVPVNQESPAHA